MQLLLGFASDQAVSIIAKPMQVSSGALRCTLARALAALWRDS